MTRRTVAITLKIPDNEAYTALTALRRLGVQVSRVERAEIWEFEDTGASPDFIERVEKNETLFNPNKHALRVVDEGVPREGETWIEELDAQEIPVRITGISSARRYVAWRLYWDGHIPCDKATVQA